MKKLFFKDRYKNVMIDVHIWKRIAWKVLKMSVSSYVPTPNSTMRFYLFNFQNNFKLLYFINYYQKLCIIKGLKSPTNEFLFENRIDWVDIYRKENLYLLLLVEIFVKLIININLCISCSLMNFVTLLPPK